MQVSTEDDRAMEEVHVGHAHAASPAPGWGLSRIVPCDRMTPRMGLWPFPCLFRHLRRRGQCLTPKTRMPPRDNPCDPTLRPSDPSLHQCVSPLTQHSCPHLLLPPPMLWLTCSPPPPSLLLQPDPVKDPDRFEFAWRHKAMRHIACSELDALVPSRLQAPAFR